MSKPIASQVLSLLNLNPAGLKPVSEAASNGESELVLEFLLQYFRERTSPVLHVDGTEKARLIAHIQDRYAADAAESIRTADEVSALAFVFRHPWDMERTFVPVRMQNPIDWEHIPALDPEWMYMMNRHRYWIALGQAYWLTGEEKYARTFAVQLEDWIDRVPLTAESASTTWRTIEAGIRCENWIKAFAYFRESPSITPTLFAKMLISLHRHGTYLAAHHDGWRNISNWGILENHGLFDLAVFAPEFKKSGEWRELAVQRLKQMMPLQVLNDGFHWEQSPMYHNEVLHCLLDNAILAAKNGFELGAEWSDTIRRMAYADRDMAKPSHHQPMLGDSDHTDIRDMITPAAYLLNDGSLKFAGFPELDYDHVWMFGLGGIRDYGGLAAVIPHHTSRGMPESGNFIMRSGWKEEDAYLLFHCGAIGGGHGHADMLHIEVHAYGQDLLTDSGRYNYSDDYPQRRELKSCASHNTTRVDGLDFTECLSSWTFGRRADPIFTNWITAREYDYAEGSHDGYRFLDDPVTPLRRILFVKPGYWLVCDSFDAKSEHRYEQHFHFPPGDVRLDGTLKSVYTNNAGQANLRIIPVHHDGQFTAELKPGAISYAYNRIEPRTSVIYSRIRSGFTSMTQILYPLRAGNQMAPHVEIVPVTDYYGAPIDPLFAEACKVTLPNSGECHTIVICHKKPSVHQESYIVDGIQIYGEVILMKQKSAGAPREVIRVKP